MSDPTKLRWHHDGEPVACRYVVAVVDETTNWNLENLKNGPRPDHVMTTYFFSPDIGDHWCSAEVLTNLRLVESYPTWDGETPEDTEALQDEIREAMQESESDSLTNRHRWMKKMDGLEAAMEAPMSERVTRGKNWIYVGEATTDEEVEDLFEYVQCNSVL